MRHLGEGKAGRRMDLLDIIDISVQYLFSPGGDIKQSAAMLSLLFMFTLTS